MPTTPTIRRSYHAGRRGFASRCHVNVGIKHDPKEFKNLLDLYQTRCVKRLQIFLNESKRMSPKVQEVFDKLTSLGIEINSMEIDSLFSERITNKRKRPRGLRVELTAKKNETILQGALLVTPSSIRVYLGSDKIASGVPIYSITYYRNLVVHDNYLAALVKGESIYGKRRFF